MDIVAKTVLDFVQSLEGCENSVIAGGSVRDYLMPGNNQPRDYDIFIPMTDFKQSLVVNKAIKELIKNEVTPKNKGEYPETAFTVDAFEYEGKLFDLIFRKDIKDTEDFGSELIETFNFGINMAFYDGLSVNTNNKFDEDKNYYYATLYDVDSEESLVKSMEKYLSLRDKYGLMFRNRAFEFKQKRI